MEISQEEYRTATVDPDLSITVDFSKQGNSRKFIRHGWHGADERFTWVKGDSSSLEFAAPYSDRDLTLAIRLGSIGGAKPTILPFKILINDYELVAINISVTRDVYCTIPKGYLEQSTSINVTLIHPIQVRPCDINPSSTDSRPLSFAIYALKLHYARHSSDGDILARYLREQRLGVVAALQESLWSPASIPAAGSLTIDFGMDGNHYQYVNGGWSYRGGKYTLGRGNELLIRVPLPVALDYEAVHLHFDFDRDGDVGTVSDFLQAHIECNGVRIATEVISKRTNLRRTVALTATSTSIKLVLRVVNNPGSNEIGKEGGKVESNGFEHILIRSIKIQYVSPLQTIPLLEEQAAVSLVDDLLAKCREKEAVSLTQILWRVTANRSLLIHRMAEAARIRCDVASEMNCLLWVEDSDQDVVFELAGRLLSCGRPFSAAERLRTRQTASVQNAYELGLAYRNLGWFDLAVRSQRAVIDPHPHWGGPIKNIRVSLWTLRREAINLLRQYRAHTGRRSEETEARLAWCLLRIGRLRAARYVMARSPRSNLELWARFEASIIFRESGAATALHFFRHIGSRQQAQSDSKILLADLLNQSGNFMEAASVYRNVAFETKNDSLFANSAIAYCLNGAYKEASSLWQYLGDTIGISNYVAQVVISEFAARPAAHHFRLVTHPFADGNIPPTRLNIFQFWDDEQIPEDVKSCTESWSSLNRDANYQIYSEEAARHLIFDNYGTEAVQCFDACHHPAMKSDFFRILALHLFGGLYVDTDLVCKVPIRETLLWRWVSYPDVLLFPLVPAFPYAANNDVLLANKGSKILEIMAKNIISTVSQNVRDGVRSDIGQVTGPGLLTKTIARQLLECDKQTDEDTNALFVAIPFPYRRSIIASNNRLEYFTKKTHWSLL